MRFNKILLFSLLTFLFSNEKQADKPIVSIHAEDAPLSMILSMLAEESGYNIVTGPNVNSQEKLSIHMDDVSVDQAINLVKLYDGQFPEDSVEKYLDYYQMKRAEFDETIDKWANTQLFEKVRGSWKPKFEIM